MQPEPLVSVCMPCFNAARFLRASLDSVLNQTYRAIEIVAVNDGSTDSTADILDEYARKHGVVTITQENAGQSAAANRAFGQATGQLIKFFDADDLLSPDMIEKQVQRIGDQDDCVASAAWGRFHEAPEDAVFMPEEVWCDLDPLEWLLGSLKEGRNMMQCALWLIPRPVLDRSGLWNEATSLINDFDFIPRVLLASRRVLFTDAKLYYRSGIEGSLSGQKSRRAYQSATLAVENFCQTLLRFENSERTRRTCADTCQSYYYEIAAFEPDLGSRLKTLAEQYGGSQVRPAGGPVFSALSSLIGWERATRLRAFAKTKGYSRFRSRLSFRSSGASVR